MNIQSRWYPVRLRVKILAILPNWICFGRLQTVDFVPTKLSNIKLRLNFPRKKVFYFVGHFHVFFCRDDTSVSWGKLFVSFAPGYKACFLLACHIYCVECTVEELLWSFSSMPHPHTYWQPSGHCRHNVRIKLPCSVGNCIKVQAQF